MIDASLKSRQSGWSSSQLHIRFEFQKCVHLQANRIQPIRKKTKKQNALYTKPTPWVYAQSTEGHALQSKDDLTSRCGLIRPGQLGLDVDDIFIGLHLNHSVDLGTAAHQLHCICIRHALHRVAVLREPVEENVRDRGTAVSLYLIST